MGDRLLHPHMPKGIHGPIQCNGNPADPSQGRL